MTLATGEQLSRYRGVLFYPHPSPIYKIELYQLIPQTFPMTMVNGNLFFVIIYHILFIPDGRILDGFIVDKNIPQLPITLGKLVFDGSNLGIDVHRCPLKRF